MKLAERPESMGQKLRKEVFPANISVSVQVLNARALLLLLL